MSRKEKKKVVIATDEEVAAYSGAPAPASAEPQASGAARAEAADQGTGEPQPADPLEQVRAQADEWKDKFLRAKAELANYQRRVEKDHAEALRYALAVFAKALLPVLDDLERIVHSSTEHPENTQAFVDGVRLTLDGFCKVLTQFDVTAIEAAGRPFNPSEHEAVLEQPSPDHAERTVLHELVKGYRLHDRVLRPARVIVSKPNPDADGDKPEGADKGADDSASRTSEPEV